MNVDRKRRRGHCDSETECEQQESPSIPIQLDELVDEFLVKTRRLLVVGEIDEISSTHICSYLQLFSLKPNPVYMYINSPGGCLASGYAIIDQMLACRCPIITVVRGQAHSMGAMIAAFGKKGHRYATPNSSLMLHSIVIQNASGTIEHHKEMTDHLQDDYRRKVADLSKRMNVTTKQLLSLMQDTKWMSPKQAIRIGVIDGIWTPRMEKSIDKRSYK